jgi:hypothetical protein
MAVISISIVESAIQIVSGIPKTVALSANVPSTILYTLDGTIPNLFSTIYTGPIFLPIDSPVVNLQALATNGTDSSAILSEIYTTDITDGGLRLPHSSGNVPVGVNIPDLYPFGTNTNYPNGNYNNPADSGITVNDPTLPTISNGFDADGYPTNFTNLPYNSQNYEVTYTTTDAEGRTGNGIGTLPAATTFKPETPVPNQSQQFSNMFDPRALVIFQDFTKEDPNDPPTINRQFFSTEDPEKSRDGSLLFDADGSGIPPSGTFIRSEYNPRTGMLTSYFRDSWSNKWVISTSPYTPGPNAVTNLSTSSSAWGGKVFEWVAFQRRSLF